ncbi:MAG TPA: polysaccharide biosynthesis/export family protein [Flavobacterium sp.]|jgi:polysaccharide export outer membrane protein
MKLSLNRFLLLLIASFFIISCGSRKDIIYLQNIDTIANKDFGTYEPTLKPDDLLSIIISAETPEVTMQFNLPQIQGNYQVGENQTGIKTYLIDSDGNIDFPTIGRIKLGGLTRKEAINKLSTAISEYITNPSVNMRILNYKVSVLGEVLRPGTFTINSERFTLLEALSMAGDLTIFGKRDNILIIRETAGKKVYTRVDMTKADFLSSPFYYLTQNDVIVVEPNAARVNASVIGPNISVILSSVSLLITITTLILLR